MKTNIKLAFPFLLAVLFLITGCTEDYIKPAPSSLADLNLGVIFYENIPYDSGPRNTLDVIVPKSKCDPMCPIVVHIHGGAFRSGDKTSAYLYPKDKNGNDLRNEKDGRYVNATRELLKRGIAVATVNYTYLRSNGNEVIGLKRQMDEITRAVQTLKFIGSALDVQPNRMLLSGHSAGAGAAFWLAFSDDKADPNSSDPILLQSSRVLGVYAFEGQATYDIVRWNDDVMPTAYVISDLLDKPELSSAKDVIRSVYALDNFEAYSDLYVRDVELYRKSLDMLSLLTADDPEFWIDNSTMYGTYRSVKTENALYHSGEHAEALHRRAQEVGVTHTAISSSTGSIRYLAGPQDSSPIDFAARILGVN